LNEEHQVAAAAVMLLQTSCFPNVMCHKTKIVPANSGKALFTFFLKFCESFVLYKNSNLLF
jgi:hypothetical protein